MTATERAKRALAMLTLFRHGKTLEAIGAIYGISRERVRQVLEKHTEYTRSMGGAMEVRRRKVATRKSERDSFYMRKYGLPHAEYFATPAVAREAFKTQRKSAGYRALDFSITFADWWKCWQESGHWEQRGRGRNNFCMARIDDKGGYSIGNVTIITNAENSRLYALSKIGTRMRPRESRGVCKLLPGYRKPWIAYHNRTRLGYFATEAEARAARDSAIRQAA